MPDVTALSLLDAMTRPRIMLVQVLMKLAPRLTMKAPILHPQGWGSEGTATWPTAGATGRSFRALPRPGPRGRAPGRLTGDTSMRPAVLRARCARVLPRERVVSSESLIRHWADGCPRRPSENHPTPFRSLQNRSLIVIALHHTSQRVQPSILTVSLVVRRHRGGRRGHRRAGPSCRLW